MVIAVCCCRLPHYIGQNEAFEVGMFPAQCVVHLGDTKGQESLPTSEEDILWLDNDGLTFLVVGNARDDGSYPNLTR